MRIFRSIMIAGIFLSASLLVCGCQGDKNNTPTMPANPGQEPTGYGNSHYLWGYFLVKIDPIKLESEIIPVREVSMHFNVLKFLEQTPCTDCFKIASISPDQPGTYNVDISIKHPFSTPNLTGFDVRGIAMFNGSKVFPVSGLRISDSSLGDGELLNADGYTTLYNPATIDHAPLEGYFQGKSAKPLPWVSPATLNGYKRFITNNPSNTRNVFCAGDTITVTYNVKLPTPLIMGYAVDASWAPPINKPVLNPIEDFPLEANCPEPWKIEVTDLGPGLMDCGGSTTLQINVYDRGGKSTFATPIVECPGVFDGPVTAVFQSESSDYSSWHATIENPLFAVDGYYRCLVSIEDNLNDPIGKPWMDITAYQVFSVHITSGGKLLWAKRAGSTSGMYHEKGYGIATLSDNSTVEVGMIEGSATFGEGEPNETILIPVGLSDIFIAQYNPDGTLAWAKSAGGSLFDGGYGVATPSDNSAVVTGHFDGTAAFGEGESNQTMLDGGGIFVARYNPDGEFAWAKRAGDSNGGGVGYGVTALSDNSTVITGGFGGTTVFGKDEAKQVELTAEGDSDIFVARYNPDGTLAWAKRAGGPYDYTFEYAEEGYGIAALPDNSTVVTGLFYNTATFGEGEPDKTVLISAGQWDIFIARYNPDGTLAWAKRAGGSEIDWGRGVTTLSDNSTVVTGCFVGIATFGEGEPNQTVLESAGYEDIFIARYNTDGLLAWAKRSGGPHYDVGNGVTTLSDDSAVVTGLFYKTATFGDGEPNQTGLISKKWEDIFIARYNLDGTLAWAKSAGGWDWDEGLGVTSLSDNSTAVTGMFGDTASFGKGEPNETALESAGGYDIFIARYMP